MDIPCGGQGSMILFSYKKGYGVQNLWGYLRFKMKNARLTIANWNKYIFCSLRRGPVASTVGSRRSFLVKSYCILFLLFFPFYPTYPATSILIFLNFLFRKLRKLILTNTPKIKQREETIASLQKRLPDCVIEE